MKISIVIPNYNGAGLLKKNLPAVFTAVEYYKKKTKENAEIIIVDDCSIDNSIEQIQDEKVKIIKNKKNLGFASTVNKGVDNATGDIVVLLNTDVTPKKDFLEPLVSHFQDKKVFAVGCLDKSMEDGKIVKRGRGIVSWKKGLFIHRRGEVNKKDTCWVSGGSGAFRKSIWEKLGGFDPLYNPFYWEDIDICYRALKSGYRLLFEPKSVVEHRHQEGVIKSNFSERQVKTIAYRNQLIFIWKNITDMDLQITHWLILPYHLIRAFIRGDIPFLLGFMWGFIKIPAILASSFKAQKLFTLSDRDLLDI